MFKFQNSTEAFEILYNKIMSEGIEREGTKTLFNIGFYIHNPLDRVIYTKWRKFNKDYAELEWEWYLSGNRKVNEIGKVAKIWLNMINENGEVNSNYGYQWMRGKQLEYVINELKQNPSSRRAVISIYDGKENKDYKIDTPCTLSLHFQIIDGLLCMTVNMRSNDLVFGFCNDQYTFSKLQELIANKLGINCGWYYHFASNIHIYERHYNLKEKYVK